MKKYKSTLLFCYLGYVTQSIVVNLAPLFFVIFRRDMGFSYTYLANLVLITFALQIVIDAAAIKFVSVIGFRTSALLSMICSFVGLVLLAIFPHFSGFKYTLLIAVLFYSAGGGLTEVVISPIVDALPSEAKEASMSLLHSFYSWGQVAVVLISTAVLHFIGESRWTILPLLWAVIPFVGFFGFLKVPIIEPEKEEKTSLSKGLLKSKLFILTIVMMICSGAAEQVMSQWASLFCEQGLGVSKVVGDLFGPCLFAAFMGVGRTFYGIFGKGINLRRSLTACSALTVLCYIAAVFSKSPVLALAGCSLCGLGVSLMWPGMLSLSSSKFPTGGPSMFAILALGGDVGCSIGPFLTGLVSDFVSSSQKATDVALSLGIGTDQPGLNAGILAGIIFPIVMFIGTFAMKGKISGHE